MDNDVSSVNQLAECVWLVKAPNNRGQTDLRLNLLRVFEQCTNAETSSVKLLKHVPTDEAASTGQGHCRHGRSLSSLVAFDGRLINITRDSAVENKQVR